MMGCMRTVALAWRLQTPASGQEPRQTLDTRRRAQNLSRSHFMDFQLGVAFDR